MADSVNGQWQYTLGFDKCGIAIPSAPGTPDSTSGEASKFSINHRS